MYPTCFNGAGLGDPGDTNFANIVAGSAALQRSRGLVTPVTSGSCTLFGVACSLQRSRGLVTPVTIQPARRQAGHARFNGAGAW